MTQILVVDPLSKSALLSLQTFGAGLTYAPELRSELLVEAARETEILVVRDTAVDVAAMDAAPSLALIVQAGARLNTIDINAATQRGIYVANCPGKDASAVAELVIGLLIAADRNIVTATNDLRAGDWKSKTYPNGMGLAGRTIGIVGFGAAGQAVAAAARGLGMDVVAWSRTLTPKKAMIHNVGFCATPNELAHRADVVSVHLAANAATYHFVDRRFLQQMHDGAYLINTSRGELVDSSALKEAIRRKGLRVALDVFENEPTEENGVFADTELASMIIATPHLGASTRQAIEEISREVIRVIGAFIASGIPSNVVNAPADRSSLFTSDGFEYAY